MISDICPVSAVSFAVRKYGCAMGVMITASHNPAEYNGYKVYGPQGAQITDAQARQILKRIDNIDIFADVSWLNFASAKKTEYFDFAGDELMSEYIDAAMAYALPWTEDELAAAKRSARFPSYIHRLTAQAECRCRKCSGDLESEGSRQ